MTHTLVTFLDKGRDDPRTGYHKASYRFPGGALSTTSLFGLALARHVAADRLVILGTPSSMWAVLVERAAPVGEEKDARIALIAPARHAPNLSYPTPRHSHSRPSDLDPA
jgi:hypothetical protein